MPRPTTSPRAVPRRLVLGLAGAAVLGVGGCRSGSDGGPATAGSSGPPGPTGAPVDADTAVVDGVRHDLAVAHEVVARAVRAFPSLGPDLSPLARLHRRHAVELGGLPEVRRRGAPASAVAARTAVDAAEQRLQRRLGTACVAAASGTLAARLASMVAAVAQQQALRQLDQQLGRQTGRRTP